jgi:hypothetical protein
MQVTNSGISSVVQSLIEATSDVLRFVTKRIRGSRREGRLRIVPAEKASLSMLARTNTTIQLGPEQLDQLEALEGRGPGSATSNSTRTRETFA